MDNSTFNYYKLGNTIRELRNQKGYSQQTLAERADISINYLSHIENGLAKFSFPVLLNIINALESTPNRILLKCVKNEKQILEYEFMDKINELSITKLEFLLKYLDLLNGYSLNEIG